MPCLFPFIPVYIPVNNVTYCFSMTYDLFMSVYVSREKYTPIIHVLTRGIGGKNSLTI